MHITVHLLPSNGRNQEPTKLCLARAASSELDAGGWRRSRAWGLIDPSASWRGRRRPHRSNAAGGDDDVLLVLLLLFAIATPASIPSPADARMTRWCRAAGGWGRGHDRKSPSHARPRSPCCAPAPLETGLRPCGMERARGARMEFRVG
ncbi:hypothetical protein DAI22_11g004500 [Oryza sativa Japonica Group]|nr:hypothetical protein DAI22_11g004500 [Oryza sativa Japonica Group]